MDLAQGLARRRLSLALAAALAALTALDTACGGDTPCQGSACNADAAVTQDAGGQDAGTCSIAGTFTNTLTSGAHATLTDTGSATSGTFALDVALSTGGAISISGNYSVSGGQLSITNTAATPSTVQGCIGQAAVYNLTWSGDCTQVTLHKVSDACTGRIADADGTTLTRGSAPPDAGPPDSGPPDAGPPDAGPPGEVLIIPATKGINGLLEAGSRIYWVDSWGSASAAIKSVSTSGGDVTTLLPDARLDQDLATDGTRVYFSWTSATSSATALKPSTMESIALDGTGRAIVGTGFSRETAIHQAAANEMFLVNGSLYFLGASATANPEVKAMKVSNGVITSAVQGGTNYLQVFELVSVDSSGIYLKYQDQQGEHLGWQAIGGAAPTAITSDALFSGSPLLGESWTGNLTVYGGSAYYLLGGIYTSPFSLAQYGLQTLVKWTPPSGPAVVQASYSFKEGGLVSDANGMFALQTGVFNEGEGVYAVNPVTGAETYLDTPFNMETRLSLLDAHNVYVGSVGNSMFALTAVPRPAAPAAVVSKPVFSPPGGHFEGTPSVQILSSAGATIHYTLDGSAPSSGSPVYTAPITISTTSTLQAYATLSGAADSPVASAAYSIRIPTQTVGTPVLAPASGTYNLYVGVNASSTTPNARFYYTLDGSTPTATSTPFAGSLTLTASATVQVVAYAYGYLPSATASATYTVTNYTTPAALPTFNPPAGRYATAQDVAVTSTSADTSIYFTTDGTTPTSASTLYSGPVHVAASETLQAIATGGTFIDSAVASAAYVIGAQTAAPVFTPGAGSYTSAQSVALSSATPNASLYYTIDGSTPTPSSTPYSAPINVAQSTALKAIATATGYLPSSVSSAAYVITAPATAPSFSPPGGTYASAQSVTISSTTAGANVYYTTDGSTPTPSSTHYTGPVSVSASQTLTAIATASGYSTSAPATATYVIGGANDFLTVCDGLYTKFGQLEQGCLQANPAVLSAPGPYGSNNCAALAAEITAGRATYSQTHGSACAAAVQLLGCASLDADLPADCAQLVTGAIANGSACDADVDCTNGFCTAAHGGSCPGTCAAFVQQGSSCGGSKVCDPSLACDYTSTFTCQQPSGAGGACPCQTGLWCDAFSGSGPTCKARFAASASCTDPSQDQCVSGYFCAGTNADTCLPLVGNGGDCSLNSQLCGIGFACVAGASTSTCVAWPTSGQACGNAVQQTQCVGGYCDTSLANPVCAPYVADGHACNPSLSCSDCLSGVCSSGLSCTCSPAVCGP